MNRFSPGCLKPASRSSRAVLCLLALAALALGGCGSYRLTERDFTAFKGTVQAGAGQPLEGAGVIVWAQAPGEAPLVWQGLTGAGGVFRVEVEWLAFADYYLKVTYPGRASGPLGGAGTDYDARIAAGAFKRGDAEYELDPLDIGAL